MDILLAIAIMALGAVVLGAALGFASIKFKVEGDPLVDKIEAILPQTQCGQCGFPGCKPYAEAIAKGEAEINLCPPGGMEGVQRLADLLGREVKPLDAEEKPKQVAIIDENTCIGCTLCIQACPVDAIVGAAKQMHTIIGQQCTGCELCLPPCPVECIHMEASPKHRQLEVEIPGRRNQGAPRGRLMLMNLFKFKGGVKPPTNKTVARRRSPRRRCPRAGRAAAPEHRRHAAPGRPGRRPGAQGPVDRRGRRLDFAAVHAPTSGTVLDVAMHVQPHPSGLDALCVVIEPDGKDEWIAATGRLPALTPDSARRLRTPASSASAARSSRPTAS
jgi:electron transport complex protein RnfB